MPRRYVYRRRTLGWGRLRPRGLAYRRNVLRRHVRPRYGYRRRTFRMRSSRPLTRSFLPRNVPVPFSTYVQDNQPLAVPTSAVQTNGYAAARLVELVTSGTGFGQRVHNFVDATTVYGFLQIHNVTDVPVIVNVALVTNKYGNSDIFGMLTAFFNRPDGVSGTARDFYDTYFDANQHLKSTLPLNSNRFDIYFRKRYILQACSQTTAQDAGRTGTMSFGLSSRHIRFKAPIRRRYWLNSATNNLDQDLAFIMWVTPVAGYTLTPSPTITIGYSCIIKMYFRNQ